MTLRSMIVQVLLAITVVVLLATSMKSRSEARALAASTQTLVDERSDLRTELSHLSHFLKAKAAEVRGPFAEGFDVTGDSAVSIDAPPDGLYYSIQTSCHVCPRNFGAIEAVDRSSPDEFQVFIMSFTDSLDVLREYAKKHSLDVPVIGNPSGGIVEIFPHYGTPYAIVIFDGCVVALTGGVFTKAEVREFGLIAGRRRPSDVEAPQTMRPLDSC